MKCKHQIASFAISKEGMYLILMPICNCLSLLLCCVSLVEFEFILTVFFKNLLKKSLKNFLNVCFQFKVKEDAIFITSLHDDLRL